MCLELHLWIYGRTDGGHGQTDGQMGARAVGQMDRQGRECMLILELASLDQTILGSVKYV